MLEGGCPVGSKVWEWVAMLGRLDLLQLLWATVPGGAEPTEEKQKQGEEEQKEQEKEEEECGTDLAAFVWENVHAALFALVRCGHLAAFQWLATRVGVDTLHEAGELCVVAAQHGQLNILRWLTDGGIRPDWWLCIRAVGHREDYCDVVTWLEAKVERALAGADRVAELEDAEARLAARLAAAEAKLAEAEARLAAAGLS